MSTSPIKPTENKQPATDQATSKKEPNPADADQFAAQVSEIKLSNEKLDSFFKDFANSIKTNLVDKTKIISNDILEQGIAPILEKSNTFLNELTSFLNEQPAITPEAGKGILEDALKNYESGFMATLDTAIKAKGENLTAADLSKIVDDYISKEDIKDIKQTIYTELDKAKQEAEAKAATEPAFSIEDFMKQWIKQMMMDYMQEHIEKAKKMFDEEDPDGDYL